MARPAAAGAPRCAQCSVRHRVHVRSETELAIAKTSGSKTTEAELPQSATSVELSKLQLPE